MDLNKATMEDETKHLPTGFALAFSKPNNSRRKRHD